MIELRRVTFRQRRLPKVGEYWFCHYERNISTVDRFRENSATHKMHMVRVKVCYIHGDRYAVVARNDWDMPALLDFKDLYETPLFDPDVSHAYYSDGEDGDAGDENEPLESP